MTNDVILSLFIMELRRAGASTSADIAVLLELSDRRKSGPEERSPSILSRALSIPKNQMSNIIKRLQTRNLITRVSHPLDLRKKTLGLTAPVLAAFDKYHLVCPKTLTT